MASFIKNMGKPIHNKKTEVKQDNVEIMAGIESQQSIPTSDAVVINRDESTDLISFGHHSPSYPYCPVFVDKQPDGSNYYSAYITGGISNIAEYQNLILTLMNAKPEDTVHAFIDSPGGNLDTGAALAAMTEMSKAKTITEATGLCASAGSLHLGGGKEIRVTDFATAMYHMSSQFEWGDSVRMHENSGFLINFVNEKCLAAAVARGILTEEERNSIVTKFKEIWLGATELRKRLGLSSDNPKTEAITDPTNNADTVDPTKEVEENVVGLPEDGSADDKQDTVPLGDDTESEETSLPGIESMQVRFDIGEIPALYTSSGTTVGADDPSDLRLGLESIKSSSVYTTPRELCCMPFQDAYRETIGMLKQMANDPSSFGPEQQQDPREKFTLIKVGPNHYQIFLDWYKNFWCPRFQTAFMRALDKMTSEDHITILLPGGISTWALPYIGGILSAMCRCKATITTVISGPCEFLDVVFWAFGHNRVVSSYTSMKLSAEIMTWTDFIQYRLEYIKAVLSRLTSLNLITEEQVKSFLEDNQTIHLNIEQE